MPVNIEALSGICGSISIACWVVVFSPQIVENFRRSSAEGLSIVFVVVWLAGDVFNILGAVLQGVLPTMIILAVYYTLADILLLAQCFYYRGFTLTDHVSPPIDTSSQASEVQRDQSGPNEQSPLLSQANRTDGAADGNDPPANLLSQSARRGSFRDQLHGLDGTRLSPATPMHNAKRDEAAMKSQSPVQKRRPILHSVLFNLTAVLVVCAAGVLGWWLSTGNRSFTNHERGHDHESHRHRHRDGDTSSQHSELHFNILGQVFGYICAVLYLGSRVPQLLLNYRRKSTEGISMLFFLFACIGNFTYVMSILAYEPKCDHYYREPLYVKGMEMCEPGEAASLYTRNFLVNFSWLLGSFGTLLLDAGVFVQYFQYRKGNASSDESALVVED